MEKIKQIAKMIAEKAQSDGVSSEKKIVDKNKLNNLILNILIKNKLLEKLNIPCDKGFEDVDNYGSKDAEIKRQVQNLCDFGLISGELGDLICQKFGVAKNDNNPKMPDIIDFENFDGEIGDFIKKRNPLFEYLKNSNSNFDINELEKIIEIVKSLEEQAKTEYMQELYNNKMKSIKAPNSLASSAPATAIEGEKSLTAKEIAKMSTDEFLKNEKLINKLLAKKLIK